MKLTNVERAELFTKISCVDTSVLLQKVNRILSGDENIIVKEPSVGGPAGDAIACCSGIDKLIYINYRQVLSKQFINSVEEFVLAVKGLNYHELAHLLFTDYNFKITQSWYRSIDQTQLSNKIGYYQFNEMLNLLEDCRIESLFTTEYPRSKNFFSFTASNIFFEIFNQAKGKDLKFFIPNYLLLYGRKYMFWNNNIRPLVLNIRSQLLKGGYINIADLNKCEGLIDSYIVEENQDVRFGLAFELAKILADNNIPMHNNGSSSSKSIENQKQNKGKGDRQKSRQINEQVKKDMKDMDDADTKDKKESEKDAKDTKEKGEKKKGKEGKEKSKDEDGEDTDDSIDAGEGDEDSYEKDDGEKGKDKGKGKNEKGKGKDKNDDNNSDDENDNEGDGDGEEGDGDSNSKQLGDDFKKLKEKLEGIIDKVADGISNSESILNEVARDVNIIMTGVNNTVDENVYKPSGDEKLESNKLKEVFKVIRNQLSTNIERYKSRGEIDIRSVMRSMHNGNAKMFSKERFSRIDKSKLGISILLDTSQSVDKEMFNNEIKASWCLTDALLALGNMVEVIEFSTIWRYIKKFNSNADWKRTFSDITNVASPVDQSVKDLLVLKRQQGINHSYIIIVSDGGFSDTAKAKIAIQNAKKAGVKVLWVYAHKDSNRIDGKSMMPCNWYIPISDLSELSSKFKQIIAKIQQEVVEDVQKSAGY